MMMTALCTLLQGMGSVAVETVNAGTDGMEMPVKSGSARNTLNDYVAGNRVLSSRPSERINAEETMYNHHYNRSNKTIVCFSLSECLNACPLPMLDLAKLKEEGRRGLVLAACDLCICGSGLCCNSIL